MSMGRIAAITGGRRLEPGDMRATRDAQGNIRNILIPSPHQMEQFFSLISSLSIDRVRHGNAIGTDRYVSYFLRNSDRWDGEVEDFPVLPQDGDWPLAGHRRNARMLSTPPTPSVLIAFPGGGGTANCVETAMRKGGIEVWRWEGSREEGEFRRVTR